MEKRALEHKDTIQQTALRKQLMSTLYEACIDCITLQIKLQKAKGGKLGDQKAALGNNVKLETTALPL